MKRKALKVTVTIIYIVGILCVGCFGVLYLSHNTDIPYPDQILPRAYYEIGARQLTLGEPLMIASCMAMVRIYEVEQIWKRLLFLIPALVGLGLSLHYFVITYL